MSQEWTDTKPRIALTGGGCLLGTSPRAMLAAVASQRTALATVQARNTGTAASTVRLHYGTTTTVQFSHAVSAGASATIRFDPRRRLAVNEALTASIDAAGEVQIDVEAFTEMT